MRIVTRLVLVAVLLGTGGCGGYQHATDAAVLEFHDRLEAGRFAEIYATSDDFFRRSMASEQGLRKYLEPLGQRGKLQASKQVRYSDESMGGVRVISTSYNNDFANGPGGEFFQWRVDGDSLRLYSYSTINKHYSD